MWWIKALIVVVVLCALIFVWILNRGADDRRNGPYAGECDDNAQAEALKEIMETRDKKSGGRI